MAPPLFKISVSISVSPSLFFEHQAGLTLEFLTDSLLSIPELDVDLDEWTLTLMASEGRVILITFHHVTCQLWLSSPTTGAHHFCWDEAPPHNSPQGGLQRDITSQWKSTRPPYPSLRLILEGELRPLLGPCFSWPANPL